MKTSGCILFRTCLSALLSLGVLLSPAVFAQSEEIIPDFYEDPGLYPNREYVNQSLNEQIDPFSGSLQHHYVDLHLPGNGGFDLKIVRSYNSSPINQADSEALSRAAYRTQLGLGWNMHFGRVMKTSSTPEDFCQNKNAFSVIDNPVLEISDGSRQVLTFPGRMHQPLMMTTQRWAATCNDEGKGLLVYAPDGTRYYMEHPVQIGSAGTKTIYSFYTSRIVDRNGNTATITYDPGVPVINKITTSDGRVVNFKYTGSGWAARLIEISSAGQTYRYDYQPAPGFTNAYFLTGVTRPDGTQWQYEYNPSLPDAGGFAMKRFVYPGGGAINYEYAFKRFDSKPGSKQSLVVAKKIQSDGGIWTFDYQPGSLNVMDKTTVTTPGGTITYRHIGPRYAQDYAVWRVGLLTEKEMKTGTDVKRRETYTWDRQEISNEKNLRPGQFVTIEDSGTFAPVLVKQVIVQDGQSYITEYPIGNYDTYGNPGKITKTGSAGGQRITTLTYHIDPDNWLIHLPKEERNSAGTETLKTIDRTYDARGNLTQVTEDGVTIAYTYDAEGNLATTRFPRALYHKYYDYKRGIPQTEIQPEGVTLKRVVSDAGNVTSETDGEGHKTAYTYDGLNRITAIQYPKGNPVKITYTSTRKTVTRGSLIEQTDYDGLGRAVSVTLGGVKRTVEYDALGRKTFVSLPDSKDGTRYIYDVLDRPVRITDPDNNTREFAYAGSAQRVKNERGLITEQTYRAYGDPVDAVLMQITPPESAATIEIKRDGRDRITSVVQGTGAAATRVTRSYKYNTKNQLIEIDNPETNKTLYGRDDAGNMISSKVNNAAQVNYTYDGLNRLTAITYPAATPSIVNTYDKNGKLIQTASSAATRSYIYDANGNLTAETISIDGLKFTIAYTYNANDQLITVTYPVSGRTVTYTLDVFGRPTAIEGYINAVTYWPSGQIKQIDYANGTSSVYNQNRRLFPSSFSTRKGQQHYHQHAYAYDETGNTTRITDDTDPAYDRVLEYDRIDRVISAEGPWGGGSIQYDGLGNITRQSFGESTLDYAYHSTSKRLSSVSGEHTSTFTYDAYGNIATGFGDSYLYDDVPNLRCINCDSPTAGIEYAYDPTNHRVRVTKGDNEHYEIYDHAGNLLVTYNHDTGALTEYIYLGNKRIADRKSVIGDSTAPVITVSRVPNPMTAGQDYVISWNATNATHLSFDCVAEGTGFTGYSELETSGSRTDTAKAEWIGYDSDCTWTATGPGGKTTFKEKLVTKHEKAPVIKVSRVPSPMIAEQIHTLTWETTNATKLTYDCVAEGTGWTGVQNMDLNGTYQGQAYSSWVNYPSTCTWIAEGPYGKTTYVEVAETVYSGEKPTITVLRTPNPMVAGKSHTLTWSTTHATSLTYDCVAGGTGWSGFQTMAVNGTYVGLAYHEWVGFPSTCTWTAQGPGGKTVYVEHHETVDLSPKLTFSRVPSPMIIGQPYTLTWNAERAESLTLQCNYVMGASTSIMPAAMGDIDKLPVSGTLSDYPNKDWAMRPMDCFWRVKGTDGSEKLYVERAMTIYPKE